jgi:toxin ParE1/3/4
LPFYLTHKAKADLKDIARYTEKIWGRAQRDRYLAKIDAAFHDLAANPDEGRNCDSIRQGYRKYGIGKHYIFYRQTMADHIEIVRVLHIRMDIETRLIEDL